MGVGESTTTNTDAPNEPKREPLGEESGIIVFGGGGRGCLDGGRMGQVGAPSRCMG